MHRGKANSAPHVRRAETSSMSLEKASAGTPAASAASRQLRLRNPFAKSNASPSNSCLSYLNPSFSPDV